MAPTTRTTSLEPDPIQVRVSQLVDDSGMTQHAVARRLGLSRSSVSDRLRGRTRWTTAELPVVAQMLGVSMSDLLDQRGYVVVNGVVYEGAAPPSSPTTASTSKTHSTE